MRASARAEFVATAPDVGRRCPPGNVTAVATSPTDGLLTEQLYWNRTVTREALLAGADPTDAFATTEVRIARDGTLESAQGPTPNADPLRAVRGQRLVPQCATHRGDVELCTLEAEERRPSPLLETGKYQDGWLGPRGSLTLWPRTESG